MNTIHVPGTIASVFGWRFRAFSTFNLGLFTITVLKKGYWLICDAIKMAGMHISLILSKNLRHFVSCGRLCERMRTAHMAATCGGKELPRAFMADLFTFYFECWCMVWPYLSQSSPSLMSSNSFRLKRLNSFVSYLFRLVIVFSSKWTEDSMFASPLVWTSFIIQHKHALKQLVKTFLLISFSFILFYCCALSLSLSTSCNRNAKVLKNCNASLGRPINPV